MNNKEKTNKIKISLTVAVILISIISIVFFCTQVKVNASFVNGIPTSNSSYTTGSLAYAIEHDKQGFVNESVNNIFNLSNIVASGYNNVADIGYNTATCLYHRQSTLAGATLQIVNVIDINRSGYGKVDVYGRNNAHVQINDSNDKIATQLAYLIYKANGTQSGNNYNADNLKSTIYNAWHNWGFKNLVETSGIIDADFYRNSTANTFGASTYNQAEKNLAAAIANSSGVSGATSANKVDAEGYKPAVSYQGGKTFVGPLKMSYNGAGTAVSMDGKSAGWARKKADGTFEIGSGNVPNNGEFYAVADQYISSDSNITVRVTVTNSEFKARILLLKNPAASGQQLMYFGSEGGQDSKAVEWITETPPPPPPGPQEEGNAKISGFVWQDVPAGKENEFNNIYDGNESKLSGITVDLLDASGNVIATTTTSNGEYTFTNLNYDEVDGYSVRIHYNGYDYASVQQIGTAKSGSKGTENYSERAQLNAQYNPISSQVTSNNFNNALTSRTGNMGAYKGMNSESGEIKETIIVEGKEVEKITRWIEYTDINFGIRTRELPNMELSNDIDSVIVTVNNYQYRYDYATRKQFYTNNSGINIGVRYQNKYLDIYERAVYASDIQAAAEGRARVTVEVIYKVNAQNASTTLQMDVGSIANYYDANYDRIVGWADTRDKILSLQGINAVSPTQLGTVLNRCDIAVNTTLQPGESKDVAYIRYEVSQNFVFDLLNGEKEPLRYITELTSYQTRYGVSSYNLSTYRAPGDVSANGDLYAGIDTNSSPSNARVDINSILCAKDPVNNCLIEDDTEVAPGFKLQAGKERNISGTVFEDADADNIVGEGKERIGNGIYESNENVVKGVTVRLLELDENGNIAVDESGAPKVAKYSNGDDVITETDEHGNYVFGYYDSANRKYVGVLPGNYKIQYIYENGDQVLTQSGELVKEIEDVNEYKSTIVTSDIIKKAIRKETIEHDGKTYNSDKWYIILESNRYSDALDNMEQRRANMPTVINNTTMNQIYAKRTAEALTPSMNIGIERTSADTEIAAWYNDQGSLEYQTFITNYSNIDFGIIEKPKNSVDTTKDITYMIIKTSNQEVLVEGDPSDIKNEMDYVRTGLDGLVPVEIETELLHGATLELEYTIGVKNISEIDYDSDEYYFYGTKQGQVKTITINKLVDYLDAEMVLDEMKNDEDWEKIALDKLVPENSQYISNEVYNAIKGKETEYVISQTRAKSIEQNKFANMAISEKRTVKIYANKLLASKDEITIENFAEINEIVGSRPLQHSVPGNYNPTTNPASPNEPDDDTVKLIIMPPTGSDMNIVIYVISAIVSLTILSVAIILIRRKIIIKNR
ncbi:MAG: hypothetical protein HFJ48_00345 [Clostridia bacterium]|nr:hypothetical protein [Clostridia bacterium]